MLGPWQPLTNISALQKLIASFTFLYCRKRKAEEMRNWSTAAGVHSWRSTMSRSQISLIHHQQICLWVWINYEQFFDIWKLFFDWNEFFSNEQLREDVQKGVYVENLSQFEVQTVGDVLRLLIQVSFLLLIQSLHHPWWLWNVALYKFFPCTVWPPVLLVYLRYNLGLHGNRVPQIGKWLQQIWIGRAVGLIVSLHAQSRVSGRQIQQPTKDLLV